MLLQVRTRRRTAVVVAAAASVEPALTMAAFAVALTALAFVVVAFAAALPVVVFAVVAFAAAAFAVIGSAIETSTTGSSSLAIFGTRSFTMRIHTTGTIRTAIILTVTDTICTTSQFTKAGRDTATLWLNKCS